MRCPPVQDSLSYEQVKRRSNFDILAVAFNQFHYLTVSFYYAGIVGKRIPELLAIGSQEHRQGENLRCLHQTIVGTVARLRTVACEFADSLHDRNHGHYGLAKRSFCIASANNLQTDKRSHAIVNPHDGIIGSPFKMTQAIQH